MSKIFNVSEAKTETLALDMIFESHRQVARSYIGEWAERAKHCESEIEKLFLAGFIAASVVEMPQRCVLFRPHKGKPLDLAIPKAAPPANYAVCAIQPGIGDFRVDFAVGLAEDGASVAAVIECDGHEFHERTKEQAERDRSRDRDLIAKGYLVLRYTGREIWRDAQKCAAQAIAIMEGEIARKESTAWEARL